MWLSQYSGLHQNQFRPKYNCSMWTRSMRTTKISQHSFDSKNQFQIKFDTTCRNQLHPTPSLHHSKSIFTWVTSISNSISRCEQELKSQYSTPRTLTQSISKLDSNQKQFGNQTTFVQHFSTNFNLQSLELTFENPILTSWVWIFYSNGQQTQNSWF